jgi:hypothetical protein
MRTDPLGFVAEATVVTVRSEHDTVDLIFWVFVLIAGTLLVGTATLIVHSMVRVSRLLRRLRRRRSIMHRRALNDLRQLDRTLSGSLPTAPGQVGDDLPGGPAWATQDAGTCPGTTATGPGASVDGCSGAR